MKNLETIDKNAMDVFTETNPMPFWHRSVTLIVFDNKGDWYATKSVGGKKAMIENMEKGDTFCCAWTGQYSTNIFTIQHKDLKALLKAASK